VAAAMRFGRYSLAGSLRFAGSAVTAPGPAVRFGHRSASYHRARASAPPKLPLARHEPDQLGAVHRPVRDVVDDIVAQDVVTVAQPLRELARREAVVVAVAGLVGEELDHEQPTAPEAGLGLVDPRDVVGGVDHGHQVPALLAEVPAVDVGVDGL